MIITNKILDILTKFLNIYIFFINIKNILFSFFFFFYINYNIVIALMYLMTMSNVKYIRINCTVFFRMYTLRKVRHEFKENKTLDDKEKVKQCYEKGEEALALIKRQVIMSSLYSTRPLIIETKNKLYTTK